MSTGDEQANAEICVELSQFSLVDAPAIKGDDDVSIGSFTLVSSQEGREAAAGACKPTPAMKFMTATGLEPSEDSEQLDKMYLDTAAEMYLETAGGDEDLEIFRSPVARSDDAGTTKEPAAADEDTDERPPDSATNFDLRFKVASEGWRPPSPSTSLAAVMSEVRCERAEVSWAHGGEFPWGVSRPFPFALDSSSQPRYCPPQNSTAVSPLREK